MWQLLEFRPTEVRATAGRNSLIKYPALTVEAEALADDPAGRALTSRRDA
jgi:hypothetical protein